MLDFLKFLGIAAGVVAAMFFWLGFLIMEVNQCGGSRVSIPIFGHGVYCFDAMKWEPRP